MDNVLIAGGAGFIGLHLAKHFLKKGSKVTILDNLFRGTLDDEFKKLLNHTHLTFKNIDLTNTHALQTLKSDKFDIVFHLAAINGTSLFYKIPHEVLRVNIVTLLNILNLLPDVGNPNLVWTSSSEVYAGLSEFTELPIPTPENVPLVISDVSNPRFSYAGSKIVGELLCLNYARTHDYEICIVRPHNIYGPRMGHEHVIPEFLTRILERERPFQIFGPEHSRAFCYIEDFIKGLEKVAMSPNTNGEIFNIGNDKEEIKMVDLAKLMFNLFNFHPELSIHPAPLGSVLRRCPNIEKAQKFVDYEPTVSLVEGIKKTHEWYYCEWQRRLKTRR
jgi:nucleoside-diphosphate-sugar epimerase